MSIKEYEISQRDKSKVLWVIEAKTEQNENYIFHFIGTEDEAKELITKNDLKNVMMRDSSKDVNLEDDRRARETELEAIFK